MATDLATLRRLADEAHIDWVPGETSLSGLSPLAARSRLGAVPPGGHAALALREQTARTMLAAAAAGPAGAGAAAPPAHVDWRNVSGASYVSPVRDQGGCGSCVAFGTTAVLESMVRIAAKEPALAVNLSEAYAFFCLGPDHGAGACPVGGWWPDDALTAMRGGISDEANFPYTDADQPCGRGSDWKSRLTKFSSWTRKTSISAMKTYLATVGPMTACFTVYEDFYFYTGGVYHYHKATSGDVVGGHCVQIVGYDDASSCWIAKNSWGTDWGEDGHFRIAYGTGGIDAEMWGIDGAITSPLIRTNLRVVAVGAGNVWHTRRTGSGSWQKVVDRLDTGAPGDPGAFTGVSAAATINRLHVVGLVGGKAWYTRQRTGAGWAKWEQPTSTSPAQAGTFTAVSCAAIGDALHVATLAGGSIWHTLRSAKSTWQKAWTRVAPASGATGPFTALSCTAVGSRATIVGVASGALWLMTRKADGSWTAPATITSSNAVPGVLTAVGAACMDGTLNLVALFDGRPWHLERSAAGAWGAFQPLVAAGAAAPGPFSAVACADVGRTLHVLGLASGTLWHSLRRADGTWQPNFGNLSAVITGEPGVLVAVDGA